MRIKIQLFESNDINSGDLPFRTYHYKTTNAKEVELCDYMGKPNDLEDTIREFIEDYLDNFLKEKKQTIADKIKFLKEINEKSNSES